MRTISAAIAIALLATTLGHSDSTWAQSPAAEQPWSLPRAIDALKSGEERDRAAAKEYLLGLGSAAVDPLISLLRAALDTVDEPLAIIAADGVEIRIGSPSTSSVNVSADVASRLVGDCCEVLGALRARPAIPLLIQIIELNDPVLTLSGCGAHTEASRALARIGKPAEFALIEEFKNAPHRAQSSIERAESWVRKWRSHMQPPGSSSQTQAAGSVEDSARVRSRQCEEARRIQVQLGCVLERMGDQGTIAALEEALTSNTDPCDTGKSIIENTISTIRMRPSFYLNRRD
jgi:hypothetical protein